MKDNITRRNLVVNLTEQEITEYSKELARTTTLQAEIEEEKKTVTSSFKEKLDRCISDSRSLARKISTRQDFREVECEWRFDYDRRMKTLFRTDTWEQVEERKLTADELQDELDLQPAESETPDAPPPAALTIEEINRRNSTCNEWRECVHVEKCFAQDPKEVDPVCFKSIEEAKAEEGEACTQCNGTGEKPEDGKMVYCECQAGDDLLEKERAEDATKAPEKTGSRCPLCDFVGYTKSELIKHVRATHKLGLKEAVEIAAKPLPNVDHDNDGWPDPPTTGAAA